MIKDSKTKRKVISLLLAFALIAGFLPLSYIKAADEPNYAEDEAKIKDFNGSERYRSTQLEQGGGPSTSFGNKENIDEFIDGFRYRNLEPSATSADMTLWGFEIELDKEKSQRTYTDFYFTNTGNLGTLINTGNIPANDVGLNLSAKNGYKDSTYKASSEIEITGTRAQRNFNLYSNEEDLKYINSIENKSTVMAWQSNYLKDNPNGPLWATKGPSSAYGFTVNPWPNENDMLSLIKLNGSHNKKEFVQGQTITTDVTIENLDDNARERLVGQVYHPVTGEVVPGAKAYINEQDKVVIEMPQGAIDENGNINEDSIFYKDPSYKALQNLEVKFFARPRTADEFTKVAGDNEGTYTPTGAGSATINHKGENVVIDKQGIDRYDHYNLIGGFKINLDDTKYYDQGFIDGNKDDTSKHTSSKVRPGEEFTIELYVPEDKKDKDVFPHQKTPEEMEASKDKNEAVGTIDMSFINRENKGKAPEDQWKINYDKDSLPTTFTITPPKSAKAGEFIAVPLTYTYTNGSTDVHWFHFVVQDPAYNKPEYLVQVDFPSEEQESIPEIPDNDKKLSPVSYSIPEGTEFKDDKGNEWTVSIDEKTGVVTAKPVSPSNFTGGEKLQVPVIAHYKDPDRPDKDITENITAEFVIKEKFNMTARYNAKAGKAGDELSSEIILNEEDKYNRRPTKFTLDSDTYIDDKGNTWKVTIDEDTGKVTATVPDAEEGKEIDGALLNVPVKAHYYESDGKEVEARNIEVQFIASGTEGKHEKTFVVPFETKVEKDPNLKKGEIKVITEGKVGSKKVTYTIKDSEIIKEEETDLIYPQDRLIHVGEGVNDGTHEITEKVPVPFETIIEFDDSLKPGETKVTQEGEPGEKTRTTTLTIQDGKVTNTEEGEFEQNKAPVNRIIKVGRNTEGKIEHKEKIPFKYTIEYDPELKSGEYRVETPGKVGERITTWTIKNSKVDGDPTVVETKPVDAVIKVGKKDFTGEFKTTKTEAVEFETEYIVDNSLEPGAVVVEQEGELGEKETPVTHTIVNGTVTNSEEGETKQTKAPVKRIVKVGPGKTDGTHNIEEKAEVPYEVEIQFDDSLKPGEQKVVQEGVPGEKTRDITLTIENSEVTNTEIGDYKETKAPIKKIIKVGANTEGDLKHVEKIPFTYEVIVVDELKKGEYEIVKPGKAGTKTTTWTIKNSKVDDNPNVVIEQPENAIIHVGKGTVDGDHKYTNKIPFGVEIRVNPKLKKGEHKVVQKGEPGEEEITITIEDSKVTKTSDPVVTKEAKPEIIEIGDEDFTGEFEYVDKEVIPYETEVRINPDLEPNEIREVTPGSNGSKERTVSQKYKNGDKKDLIVSEYEITKEPVKRVIEVGSKTKGQYKDTETIPFKVEVRKDPSLKKGEWKYAEIDGVLQTGESGLKERMITIENSEITNEGEYKIVREPKKAIILVGDEDFTGKIKYVDKDPIPFETEVTIDPSLKPGQIVEDQKGELGEEETEVTRQIKNGVAGEEVRGETKKTKEPVTRKIRVGSKSDGTHKIEEKAEVPFEVIIEFDDSLKPGEQKVVQEGVPGEKTRTTTLTIENGKVVKTEEGDFEQTKAPVSKIIKVGRNTDGKLVHEEKIPFKYEISYDENLKSGEYVIDVPGTEGTKTTTWTIKNSEVVGEPEVDIKDPVNAVIRVGKKDYTGTLKTKVTKTVMFETEYIVDESLEPGQIVVEREGSLGEEEVTVTHTIKNGEVIESKEGKPVTTKEATKRIVKVGPGKTEGEITYESEKAYEIIVQEDPNLEAGKVEVVQEGVVGKTKTTVKIKDSKEESIDTEVIVEKQDKIIKVGTKSNCVIPPQPEPPDKPEDPEKPGIEDPEKPGEEEPEKPGEEEPEKPGEEEPEKPGEEEPEKPGEEEPEKPGEEEPEKPGEEEPEKPGEEEPEKPGNEDPIKPEKPSDKKPAKPGQKSPDKPGNNKANKPQYNKPANPSKPANQPYNPKTGDNGVMYLVAVVVVAGLALFFISKNKKK